MFYIKYSCGLYCIPRNETSQFCIGWVKSDWKRDFGSFRGDLVDEIVKVNEWKISRSSDALMIERERERKNRSQISKLIPRRQLSHTSFYIRYDRGRLYPARSNLSLSFDPTIPGDLRDRITSATRYFQCHQEDSVKVIIRMHMCFTRVLFCHTILPKNNAPEMAYIYVDKKTLMNAHFLARRNKLPKSKNTQLSHSSTFHIKYHRCIRSRCITCRHYIAIYRVSWINRVINFLVSCSLRLRARA